MQPKHLFVGRALNLLVWQIVFWSRRLKDTEEFRVTRFIFILLWWNVIMPWNANILARCTNKLALPFYWHTLPIYWHGPAFVFAFAGGMAQSDQFCPF